MRAWRVLGDGRYVAITATEDLLTDAAILCEDIQRAMRELSQEAAYARDLVAASRKRRRLRTTTLRLVGTRADGQSDE
jgi:hypothetical protein